MRIRDMFAKDIDRSINGVVKVADDKDQSIEQELSEYVVTRELLRHFSTLLDAYGNALDNPTDKIGVWISGFFGSGKSHFLKMLSYLLANAQVAGRPAVDYFEGKFDDPFMEAKLRRCCSVPTESILFNIDNKGFGDKDKTAILKVFARVFYEHLGYYGSDLKLARLESFIDRQGKTAAFREAFKRINSDSWLSARESWDFFSDDMIDALVEADVMSRAEAERWCNGTESAEATLSIDTLVKDIAAYTERRATENGGQFRLLFMVDEVGQYIGDDVNLMLNLQSLVEELGVKCAGRVWVMVTSQEAIDSITKVASNDFSKIQGRFNTRLSLSSSSVDEVIKRRVLAKNDEALALLRMQYQSKAAVLRNLFTFEGAQSDLTGYSGEQDFVEAFPFASYQFKVMQNVFTQIRKHGSSGKHLSAGERSMLSGFQEAAQAVAENNESSVVPFYRFYDTVHTFLEGDIRRVIERCQKAAEDGNGVEPQDVDVLKLLFLIRYIDEIPSNLNNITILMADAIDTNKIDLRENAKASLDRLIRENYISRTGELYTFLTDEEQDIARAIRDTQIDLGRVTEKIAGVVFGDIFKQRKLHLDQNDFPIDLYIDETRHGSPSGGMILRVITAASDLHNASRQELITRSMAPEALVVLSDEKSYFEVIESAAKIEQYVRGLNVPSLPPSTQKIIDERKREQHASEAEARDLLEEAIVRGNFYVAGNESTLHTATASKLLEELLKELVSHVFTKLNYIDHYAANDAELLTAASGKEQRGLDGELPNRRAREELLRYLQAKELRNIPVPVSMGDLQNNFGAKPYGWREIDVALVVASLFGTRDLTLHYGQARLAADDRRLPDMLRSRTKTGSVQARLRKRASSQVIEGVRDILKDFTGIANIPSTEDDLMTYAKEVLENQDNELKKLLETQYHGEGYPGQMVVEGGRKLCQTLLQAAEDPAMLFDAIRERKDDLLDLKEDLSDVRTFFAFQRPAFDSARQLVTSAKDDKDYLEEPARDALDKIQEILAEEKPYKNIRRLPDLIQTVKADRDARVKERSSELLNELEELKSSIEAQAKEKGVTYSEVTDRYLTLRDKIHTQRSLALLDTIQVRMNQFVNRAYTEIDRLCREKSQSRLTNTNTVVTHRTTPSSATNAAAATEATTTSAPKSKAPAQAQPKVKKIKYLVACPPKPLSNEDEVNAYVESLRTKLLEELAQNDMVQLCN